MNISAGGPHILLFERDQQLAALLMSELQLAGYEGHAARTAVEVFDAIARYPVRLVLVNLAQAAAARREFWVALDTQRRGGSIQVLTFQCTNLAGYGPRDLEERLATVADIEIDGMLGMMKLLEVIRARVPNVEVNAGTIPRMSRAASSPSGGASRFTQPIPVLDSLSDDSITGTGMSARNVLSNEGNGQFAAGRVAMASLPNTPLSAISDAATGSLPVSQVYQATQAASAPTGGRNAQAAYPEKIRAVIYPSQQRNWNTAVAPNQQTGQLQDAAAYVPLASQASAPAAPFSSDTPVLQGLAASGQRNDGAVGESGLAQLTRMVQESQVSEREPSIQVASPVVDTYVLPTYTPPTARAGSISEAISSQVLRPAPIQDLPEERLGGVSQSSADGPRRPEVFSRANYDQASLAQIASSAMQSPLASIAASGMAANAASTATRRETVEDADRSVVAKDSQKSKDDLAVLLQVALQTRMGKGEGEAQLALGETDKASSEHERERAGEQDDGDGISAENSVILDILQSLPPMPAIEQQQAVQPQVLNGRITRSLGSVLLDGHLVPQERLEVAQNIQRMLRGVDLNYQLGEILLMFKLLTPDQLLAASLVSYGLITTTQISAFGRIRQELYSIGLEYDLENLLVLFRVLTPEQLREARANIRN